MKEIITITKSTLTSSNIYFHILVLEEKAAKFKKATEHIKDMLDTRNYYRDRKLKREEIVAREFLKKAVREVYIEQEDRNKRKVLSFRKLESFHQFFIFRISFSRKI